MTITIKDYPSDATFKIEPMKRPGNHVRTVKFRAYLRRNPDKYRNLNHEIEDYIVEGYTPTKDGEEWHIGS